MNEESRKKLSGALKMLLKAAIAAAVLIFLYCHKGEAIKKGFASYDYRFLLPAFMLSFIAAFAGSERWRILAEIINIPLKKLEAFSLTMQGIFFSLVIPGGAIGGDVVKMAAMSRHVKSGSRTEGIFSIMIDRIVGMFALFLPVLILLLCNYHTFAGLKLPGFQGNFAGLTAWWVLTGACAAGLAGGTALFFHRQIGKIPGIRQLLGFLDEKSSGKVTRIFAAADIYAGSPGKMLWLVLLSVVAVHLVPVLVFAILFAGTGAQVGIFPLCTAVLIGNIAGLIPLFPGGIGARDLVTVGLLTSAGYAPETVGTVQLLATGLMIIFNLTGSLFFIFDRKLPEENYE